VRLRTGGGEQKARARAPFPSCAGDSLVVKLDQLVRHGRRREDANVREEKREVLRWRVVAAWVVDDELVRERRVPLARAKWLLVFLRLG
jgi:hypothetical protein